MFIKLKFTWNFLKCTSNLIKENLISMNSAVNYTSESSSFKL